VIANPTWADGGQGEEAFVTNLLDTMRSHVLALVDLAKFAVIVGAPLSAFRRPRVRLPAIRAQRRIYDILSVAGARPVACQLSL
jgi:hypothetical protein